MGWNRAESEHAQPLPSRQPSSECLLGLGLTPVWPYFLLWPSAQALCPVLEDGTVHVVTEVTVSLGMTLSSFSQP